jgi:hypothetical protein
MPTVEKVGAPQARPIDATEAARVHDDPVRLRTWHIKGAQPVIWDNRSVIPTRPIRITIVFLLDRMLDQIGHEPERLFVLHSHVDSIHTGLR